jgi:hypothetical protein
MNRKPAKSLILLSFCLTLEIGNLNVLGNGYLEGPKKWWVVASWVRPVCMKYKHTIAMSHLFNHEGLGWKIMSFP